jgi:hypothetical protein
MINSVVEQIRENIATLNFVSKSAGVVREQIKDKQRFPVIAVNDECTGDYTDLLPNSKESCIVFFELLNNSVEENRLHSVQYSAELRACVWVNTKLINPNDVDLIAAHISNKIAKTVFTANASYIKHPKTLISSGVDYKNPYSKYTIDENKNQFLMKPYAGFSINFKLDYIFVYDCLPGVTLI